MRLSGWRASAPKRAAMTPKVTAVLEPLLVTLGIDADPHCWIVWGDDPSTRYTVLVPTPAGLAVYAIRVAQEGPRVSGRLVRWARVQLSELSIESQAGHRLLTFQIEQHVLRGADAEADRIGDFVRLVFAAIDGRPVPQLDGKSPRSTKPRTVRKTAKPAGAPRGRPIGAGAAGGRGRVPGSGSSGGSGGGSRATPPKT